MKIFKALFMLVVFISLSNCAGIPHKKLISRASINKAMNLPKNAVSAANIVSLLKAHPHPTYPIGMDMPIDENGVTLFGTYQDPFKTLLLPKLKAFYKFDKLTISCVADEKNIELFVSKTFTGGVFWNREFIFPQEHFFEAVAACEGLLALGVSYNPILLANDSLVATAPKTLTPASPSITKQHQPPKAVQRVYAGTGFLFSSKDYVITNHHLVRGRSSIKVTFLDGEVIDAKIVSVDKQNDIAFLKLSQSPKIPPSSLRIADSSTVKLGDKIFTIGYPASHLLGKSPKYSEGVINSIWGISDNPAYFQISVPIQPGNSGGPLFNERGEVIGITTSSLDSDLAKDAMGAVPQNINYAVKSLLIKNLMPTIPDIMVASRGIVVVPTEPENNLSNFIESVQNNIVLIEAKE